MLTPGVLALALAALGVVLLVVFVVRAVRTLRRFSAVRTLVSGDLHDRVGHLKARGAGLRVALEQRRHRAVE